MEKTKTKPVNYADETVLNIVRKTESLYVKVPRFVEVFDLIASCHQHSKYAAEPQCILLMGEQGTGKTTIGNKYLAQYPAYRDEEGDMKIPVFRIQIPAMANPNSLSTALLKGLRDPLYQKGNNIHRTDRLVDLLESCGTELIIMDEFQHFVDRKTDNFIGKTSDWLKNLINDTGIPILLIGMPNSHKILDLNPQLKRRFPIQHQLEGFSFETTEEQNEFQKLLRMIGKHLPLTSSFSMDDWETGLRFFKGTRGKISELMALLRSATTLALTAPTPLITYELLAKVWQQRNPNFRQQTINPFLEDANKVLAWQLPQESLPQLFPTGKPKRGKG